MKEDPHTIVASAVLYRAFRIVQDEEAAFKEFWQKGQTATQGIERLTEFPKEITYQDVKYSFTVMRRGPDSLVLSLRGEDIIDARIRERSDGVLLGIWGGRTHEIDGLEEPLGLCMVLDAVRLGCCRIRLIPPSCAQMSLASSFASCKMMAAKLSPESPTQRSRR